MKFPGLEKSDFAKRKVKAHKSGVQSVGVFARKSIEIRGSYLQHARTHGQAILQQKLLERRQAVLAVEKCIYYKPGRGKAICQTCRALLPSEVAEFPSAVS
jgi:hypothetical protein